jgi:HlyD family secretion protein
VVVAIAFVGLAACGLAAWPQPRGWLEAIVLPITTVESAPVAGPAVQRLVHAIGRLEPRGTVLSIAVPSGNDGARIDRLLVAEGQDVAAGEVVAVLDGVARREATVREAEARVATCEARLAQVRAGAKPGDIAAQEALVERMEAQREVAARELERARPLVARGVLTAEQFDTRRLALDTAVIDCHRARDQLASLREVRDVDVRMQEAEVAAAVAGLGRAKADLEAASVRSPVGGRVLRIHARPGERPGDAGVLDLGDVAHMEAVAEVFEGDLPDVRMGQGAEVEVTGSGMLLRGEVVRVGMLVARKDVLSNDPVSDTDARVVEVRIALDPQDVPHVEGLANARIAASIDVGPQGRTARALRPGREGRGQGARR